MAGGARHMIITARLLAATSVLLLLAGTHAHAAVPDASEEARAALGEGSFFPTDPPIAAFSGESALPEPTITEPAAVGEALNDPTRAGDAVVSLLRLLHASIVPDGADDPPKPGLTYTRSEVRLLIAMAREDAAAQGNQGPASFADLHSLVEPFVPAVSVEKLAAAYAGAYEAHPDALVPQVLLGQPIEPAMSLSRVQIWLLLVDGFSRPAAMQGGALAPLDRDFGQPRIVPAVLRTLSGVPAFVQVAAAGGPAFGTAQPAVASLVHPVAGFSQADAYWFLVHVQTLLGRIPFELVPRSVTAHEGHGSTGSPVEFEFRLRGGRAPLVRTPFGTVVFTPKVQPRPFQFRWTVSSGGLGILRAHGAVSGRFGQYQALAPGAVARLTYVPKKEAANGQGEVLREVVIVAAEVDGKDLISALYDSSFGQRYSQRLNWMFTITAQDKIESAESEANVRISNPAAVANLQVEWHARRVLRLTLVNGYQVRLETLIGGGETLGLDGVSGALEEQSDGHYLGLLWAHSRSQQNLAGFGRECSSRSDGRQLMRVEARAVKALNNNQIRKSITAASRPNEKLLQLKFHPASNPDFAYRVICPDADKSLPWDELTDLHFLEFNDTYWLYDGYVILLPEKGVLEYQDNSQSATGSTWWVKVAVPKETH
jgi:hypothetical protein